MQSKLDGNGGGTGGGGVVKSSIQTTHVLGGMEPDGLAKQLHDLEAHLNTSIITEKSVRKAQDKYLAEEIDKFTKQMIAITDKLKIHIDEEGNVIAQNRSKQESEIIKNKFDIESMQELTSTLKVEVNDLKELIERGDVLGEDSIVHKLERDLEDLKITVEARTGGQGSADAASVEMVDKKIQALLEKLKEENQVIWKGTVEKAEKIFNLQGIEETMDLMPDALQGRHQLKSTINIIEDNYGESTTSKPKPTINKNPELEKEPNYNPSEDKKSEDKIES